MSRKKYNRPQFEGFTITSMGCEADLSISEFSDFGGMMIRFWIETTEKGKAYVAEFQSPDLLIEPVFTHVMADQMIKAMVRFLGDELKAAGLKALRNGED